MNRSTWTRAKMIKTIGVFLVLLLALAKLRANCSPTGELDSVQRREPEDQLAKAKQENGGGLKAHPPGTGNLRSLDSSEELEKANKLQTYGVIVDCGSSGTRAHIYHWDTEIDFSLQMLHDIETLRDPSDGKPVTRKVQPGLSTFADSTRQQRIDYIKPLIDFIASNIPESRHQFTGVYFMATAGMRLLDKLDRESIMNDIQQFVRQNYKFIKVDTSVISGKDEGMYQWISINAKGKRFLGYDTNTRTKTFAVIEMGGASIQVTYQLRTGVAELVSRLLSPSVKQIYNDQIARPAISRPDVAEQNYNLHSTTFLGLGVNSARDAYLDLLIHDERTMFVTLSKRLANCFKPSCNGVICSLKTTGQSCEIATETVDYEFDDPCLPKGYTSEPIKKSTRLLAKGRNRRTIGYIPSEDEATFSFKLKGSGNYYKCKKLTEKMIRVAKKEKMFCHKEDESSCTMALLGERFVPFQKFDFLAISGFYHAFTGSVVAAGEVYDNELVFKNTRNICNAPYKQLIESYPETEKEYLTTACFRAVWAHTFLVKGLKMPEDYDMLEMKNKINNDDLDWTLGAVLEKSLAIEYATEGINNVPK